MLSPPPLPLQTPPRGGPARAGLQITECFGAVPRARAARGRRRRPRAPRGTVVVYYPVDGKRELKIRRRKRARAQEGGADLMLDASQLGAQGSDGGCGISVPGPARDSAKTLCDLQRNTKKKHTPNIF